MIAILILGILLIALFPVITIILNPPTEFRYGDEVYIKDGFFKGQSGVVVDKRSAFEYTIKIDSREVKINSGDIKK